MSADFSPRAREPLALRTTLGVGGAAQFYAEVPTEEGLAQALAWADRQRMPVTILGGGSNVVVADRGVAGLVLRVNASAEAISVSSSAALVRVGAGGDWDAFVARSVARGWAGVECLSGIPGCVGATPIQNVGAYGQEVSETIAAVHAFDRAQGRSLDLSNEDCAFGYRTSRFKLQEPERFVVLAVTFRLSVGAAPCLRYAEIAAHFAGKEADLQAVRDVVLATRRSKSMLLSADDPNRRSCGSFFLNPIVSAEALEHIRARSSTPVPHFAQPDARFKVPAAWLIEQSGLERGQRWGNVGISSRHTLALVCHAGARAAELVELAHHVRSTVEQRFAVRLVPEARFLGFDTAPDELPSV